MITSCVQRSGGLEGWERQEFAIFRQIAANFQKFNFAPNFTNVAGAVESQMLYF